MKAQFITEENNALKLLLQSPSILSMLNTGRLCKLTTRYEMKNKHSARGEMVTEILHD
jgi:hypothetical protein